MFRSKNSIDSELPNSPASNENSTTIKDLKCYSPSGPSLNPIVLLHISLHPKCALHTLGGGTLHALRGCTLHPLRGGTLHTLGVLLVRKFLATKPALILLVFRSKLLKVLHKLLVWKNSVLLRKFLLEILSLIILQ